MTPHRLISATADPSERRGIAIASLGRTALREPDLQALFDTAVHLLADELDADLVKILELDADEGMLTVVSGCGWDEGIVGRARVPDGENSQAGYTLRRRQAVVVADLPSESRFHGPALLLDHGVCSGMSMIIGSERAPWGVLGVHSRSHVAYSKADVRFLETVAYVLTEAIQRREAEAALRDREHRLRLVTDAMPALIAYCDKHTVYQYCNARYTEWFGLPMEDIVGRHVREVLGPDAFEKIRPAIETVLSGEPSTYEGPVTYLHGPPRHVRVDYLPHKAADGSVAGYYAMITDITERAREKASHAWLAAIVEHSHDAIIGKDLDGVVTSWNAAAERMYGFSAEEIVGKSIATLFPDELKPELGSILDVIRGGGTWNGRETVRLHKDGTRLDVLVSVSPIRGQDGCVLGASAVAHDLTDFKTAQRERRRSEERLQLAKDAAELGIFDWDIARDQLGWDARLREIWGMGEEEPASIPRFLEDIDPADIRSVHAAIDESMDPAGPGRYYAEYRVINRRDGTVRWIAANGHVTFENGEPARMVGFVQDISERKLAEVLRQEWADRLATQLELTRKAEDELRRINRDLEEFTGIVTHDLRNPIASALFTAELMREMLEAGDHGKIGELNEVMLDALRRMDRMVKELHAQSLVRRSDRGYQQVRLEDVVTEARKNATYLLEQHQARVVTETCLPTLPGNPVLLTQLFSNLIDNAVKYRADEPPHIRIRSEAADDHHIVTVADNGSGVHDADRERIFHSGERGSNVTHTVGSGLGLPFCRRVMEAHGGSIEVTCPPAGGATFLLRFPLPEGETE